MDVAALAVNQLAFRSDEWLWRSKGWRLWVAQAFRVWVASMLSKLRH